jgi:hypothetical protein
MKTIIMSLMLFLLFSGCADKRIILVPSNTYYPTFDTSDFNVSKPYHLDMWVDDDNNETALCSDKSEMMGLLRNTKELRSNYNILLQKLNEFNKKILLMNEEQKSKKPTEVDKIPTSWYK